MKEGAPASYGSEPQREACKWEGKADVQPFVEVNHARLENRRGKLVTLSKLPKK